MIRLGTDCSKCIHAKICKNKDNAKNAMNKLKNTIYGEGPNDDYDWEIMMAHKDVVITFSCPNYSVGNVFR